MSDANKELIRRWFEEVWNQRRADAIDQMMAEDVSALGLPPEPMDSREAFKRFHRVFIEGFPHFHVSTEEVFAEDDRVAFRCRVRGTHRSGRPVEFDGGGFAQVRDGKLIVGHNVWNFHDMLEQLGAVQPNAVLNAVQGGTSPPTDG